MAYIYIAGAYCCNFSPRCHELSRSFFQLKNHIFCRLAVLIGQQYEIFRASTELLYTYILRICDAVILVQLV